MIMHNKRLQYTVQVSEPNPRLGCMIMERFGGAHGELAAAMRCSPTRLPPSAV
jgi:Mn-containing catalase